MPIRDLQAQLTEVGRIRLGLAPNSTDNPRRSPAKLDTFRFTSPNEHLIRGVAELYGGQARQWTPQNGGRRQWEAITAESRVPVFVPRQGIDPWYEQWGGGVCTRRCDGVTDIIHEQACDCNPADRGCKPTVRMSLMLADLPGAGVWRLESHGWYASTELSALAPMLANAPMPLPGYLVLDQRERKYFDRAEGKPKTKQYPVPVVLFDAVSARQLMSGAQAIHAALTGGQQPTALAAGPQPRAVEQAPQPPTRSTARPAARPTTRSAPQQPQPQHDEQEAPEPDSTIDEYLRRIEQASSRDEMLKLQAEIIELGRPVVLTDAWSARARRIAAPRQAPVREPETAEQVSERTGRPVRDQPLPDHDVEGEPEPDREATMMQLLAEAGKRGWDTAALQQRADQAMGKPTDQADGWELDTFLQMVRGGQVQ